MHINNMLLADNVLAAAENSKNGNVDFKKVTV